MHFATRLLRGNIYTDYTLPPTRSIFAVTTLSPNKEQITVLQFMSRVTGAIVSTEVNWEPFLPVLSATMAPLLQVPEATPSNSE